MMKYLLLLLLLTIISCTSQKYKKDKNLTGFPEFPLPVPEQNSLMSQWEKKPVLETKLIDDMEAGAGWKVTGIGEMTFTTERSKDGKQSMRFRTSLRNEEHYRKNRSEWDSFNGTQGGNSSVQKTFDTPQDWSAFNRLSFWVYVHPTSMLTYCLHLKIENESTVYNATYPGKEHFVQDLKPGVWNHVMFEIPHLKRDKVTLFEISQMLTGHTPEEEGIVTYDIDQLELQTVKADQYEGWTVSQGKFALCQAGYRPGDPKIALVDAGTEKNFQLLDQKENTVFSGGVKEFENINGKFRQIDFTDFQKPGVYHIKCGDLVSNPFPVDENVWIQPVFKALNFFFCERCGYYVPGIHRECHKDWQGSYGNVKKIINGGWHDAGDLSQGSWRTAMAVYSMMDNLENLQKHNEGGDLPQRLLSEISWGLDWLLKTRFGDGYHMSFSVMRIYTDNKVGTIDDVVTPAKNVPWENFLAAAVQCKAAILFEKTNPELATRSRIAAIEDWQAAVDSREKWDQADYREASWGATSSLLLSRMTGDDKYRDFAVKAGNLLISCQEQSFIDGIPITGYFYENTDRLKTIHNYHASFEEAPMIALAMLCRDLPENENMINWYSAAVLYSEFFMKRGSRIAAPYDYLPNSVWKRSEIMAEKDDKIREDMLRQFNDGTPVNNEYVLRTFPIYRDGLFHGNTNIQMSGTWALAEASRLRNDPTGMQLVGKQLQWIFGANPFGQSLMYGTGYDFAPQFAYCLKDIVGSLPVGMDCMSGDMPWWAATNTATSKEIWVEPVNRFLGAVSVYASYTGQIPSEKSGNIRISTESVESEKGFVSVSVLIKGTGSHRIGIRTFNSQTDFAGKEISLQEGKAEKIEVVLKITERNKPYVALISVDNDPVLSKEIVGSFIKSTF